MNQRLHELFDKWVPTPYYRLLTRRRQKMEAQWASLPIDELKRRNEVRYREKVGHGIDWEHPKAYTEKMQVEKFFHLYPEKTLLTDKYAVRAWVAERIGEEYLVPLCGKGVYNSAAEIDFDALPNAFVIKTNSGSGDAIIVRDKSALNRKDIRRIKARMDYQLHYNFAWLAYEMHYAGVVPKLLTEQYLDSGEEDLPDYKFLCFDGKPLYCWVDKGRYHNHKRNVYDLDWNLMPWNQKHYGNYAGTIEKPQNFDRMIALAETLAKGFAHVRVDFYNLNGRIYFGEMTFTNGAGFEPIVPYEADLALGACWNLQL